MAGLTACRTPTRRSRRPASPTWPNSSDAEPRPAGELIVSTRIALGISGDNGEDADPSFADQPSRRTDHDRRAHRSGAGQAPPGPHRVERADVRRDERARRGPAVSAGAWGAAWNRPHHRGGADRRPREAGGRRAAPEPGRPAFVRLAPDPQGPDRPEAGNQGLRCGGGRVLRSSDLRRAEGAGGPADAADKGGPGETDPKPAMPL